MIPAFAHGRTHFYLPASPAARAPCEDDKDWTYYYVNIFVDRDMFMLHRGGGVGHQIAKWVDVEGDNGDTEDCEDDEEEENEEKGEDEDEDEDEDEEVDEDKEVDEDEEEDKVMDKDEEDEDEILAYGYDHEDYENEESEEEGFVEEGENEGIEENEERRGNLGPEDGEFEDEHDGYFGYAPL